MKKTIFLVIMLLACIIGIIFCVNLLFQIKNQSKYGEEIAKVVNISTNTVSTSQEEEKVSPNAIFALKKYYDECDHFEYNEAELPKELINLTRQELEEYYKNWEVNEFSANKIVLSQEINGYCDDHFIIKLDNNKVNIYKLGRKGEMTLYEKTEIEKDFLPEEDIEELESGIMIYGIEMLRSTLEDFE